MQKSQVQLFIAWLNVVKPNNHRKNSAHHFEPVAQSGLPQTAFASVRLLVLLTFMPGKSRGRAGLARQGQVMMR